MTSQDFIEQIAPYMQKYAQKYGYKICSAAIAQACLESAYGTSPKAAHHNYFGLKYRPNRVNCNNGYFLDGGSEQNPDGSYTPLPSATAWYNFDNMEKGCEGYYQFINIPNYAAVRTASTPLEYLQAIKNAGYATSINYVQNVYNVVNKWNLTKYDNALAEEEPKQEKNNVVIINKSNAHNTTVKPNRKIEWIVLHYTAGTNSAKGSAQNTAAYFARTQNQASADFIVDDAEIVQYNPDPKNRYCWAVGGKKYSSLSNSLSAKYYGICQNNNSISIEMCSRKKNTSTLNATDDDWYLTDATVNNAILLTKYLMQTYGINSDHVIMHSMVTGKWCPQPWSKNEAALSGWYYFLNKIGGKFKAITSNIIIEDQIKEESTDSRIPYLAKVNADTLNIRSGPGTQYSIVGTVRKGSVYTIVDEENNFGKLKSGAGWLSLKYLQKQG